MKENLEAYTKAEGEGDKNDDPGEGGEEPTTQANPILPFVCCKREMVKVVMVSVVVDEMLMTKVNWRILIVM